MNRCPHLSLAQLVDLLDSPDAAPNRRRHAHQCRVCRSWLGLLRVQSAALRRLAAPTSRRQMLARVLVSARRVAVTELAARLVVLHELCRDVATGDAPAPAPAALGWTSRRAEAAALARRLSALGVSLDLRAIPAELPSRPAAARVANHLARLFAGLPAGREAMPCATGAFESPVPRALREVLAR